MAFKWTGVCSVFTFLCVAQLAINVNAQDCNNIVNIGNQKRSVTYQLNFTYGEQSLCDNELRTDIWYTFEEWTGSEIPERDLIEDNVCGATSPIYIVARGGESYHAQAKRIRNSVTAPVRSADGGFNANILIFYCANRTAQLGHDAFIYRLTVPNGCPLAYCAGQQQACTSGKYWNSVQNTCVGCLPAITSNPILQPPRIIRSEMVYSKYQKTNITVQQFGFICDVGFTALPADNGARFKLIVYFDDVASNITIPDANSTHPSFVIPEDVLQGRLGTVLRCGVKAYWAGSQNPVYTPERKSDGYWIGIKPRVDKITIYSGNSSNNMGQIDYISTVPITCWHCYRKALVQPWYLCDLPCVQTFEPIRPKGIDIDRRQCSMPIAGQGRDVLTVHVRELFSGPVATSTLSFVPKNDLMDYQPFVLWSGYTIPPTTIDFIQGSSVPLTCSASGDPHITTVYKKNIDNYLDGMFNFISSRKDVTSLNMQIQVRQAKCNPPATCICAVAVREGNDAFRVDACNELVSNTQPINRNIVRILQPATGETALAYHDAAGTTITIHFQSGLDVRINAQSWFAIAVTIPGFYQGYLDGQCTESLSSSSVYRLAADDTLNMFTVPPRCVSSSNGNNNFVCKCAISDDSECNTAPRGTTGPVVPKTTGYVCYSSRKRRAAGTTWAPTLMTSTDSDNLVNVSEVFYTFPVDLQHGTNVNLVWPTATGKTRAQATDYCNSTLRSSSAYSSCVGKFNETMLLDNCVVDVQLFDAFSGAESYRSEMERICLDTVIEQSGVTSAEDIQLNAAVMSVVNNICPNDCNGRGTCSNATCSCSTGFTGPDCSVQLNAAAQIHSLPRNGSCNLQERTCNSTSVYVSNVFDSTALTCKFRRFDLTNNSVQLSDVLTAGVLNTATEVICPTPVEDFVDGRRRSVGYRLSVSNDKALYSNELPLTVYDSTCLTCNGASCQIAANTCFISSQCVASGTRLNATANCLACVPQSSQTTWTNDVVYSAWSSCSRACDYGVRTRTVTCASVPSPAQSPELDFCRTIKCPGQTDERLNGFVMSTSSTDLKTMLSAESTLFAEVVKAVNSYCGAHAADCCPALGLTYATPSGGVCPSMNVTTAQQTYFAASNPDILSSPTKTKIIVRAATNVAREQCTGTSSLPSPVYFDKNILFAAITQYKTTIENAIGISIVSISLP